MNPFLFASLGYFSLLLLPFWPLLRGDILHSGAMIWLRQPFYSADAIRAVPFANPVTSDFVEQFAPFEDYQFHAARNGRFPTWNPQIYLGQPFHADGQSAMLFPTHWIYFLIDPNIARGPMAMLRLWLSAIALFSLLRKFSLGPSAAFAGGAIWMLSSFNIHFLLWPQSNASLWVPIALLPLDALIVKPTLRAYAMTSLATAPLFLAGHPGTVFLCGNLIGLYAICRLVGLFWSGCKIRELLVRAVVVTIVAITAMLLASAALLPLYMQMRGSFDYLDTSGHRNAISPVPWSTLWMFLVPEYFGRSRGAYPGFEYHGPENYLEMSLWFGAIAVCLAMAAVVRPIQAQVFAFKGGSILVSPGREAGDRSLKRRVPQIDPRPSGLGCQRKLPIGSEEIRFLYTFGIIAFVLSLLIVFCVWPVYSIVAAAPGMGLTNLRRFLLATHFAGAVLAACSIEQILVRRDRITAAWASGFAIAGSAAILISLLARSNELRSQWKHAIEITSRIAGRHWPQLLSSMEEQFAGFRMAGGAGLLVIGTLLLIAIWRLALRNRGVPIALRYLFVATISLDVLLPAYGFNPIAPRQIAIPPAPAVLSNMVQQTGDGRMAGLDNLLPPNLCMQYGFRDVRGYDLPHNLRLVRLYQRLGIDSLDNRAFLLSPRFYPRIDPPMQAYLDRTCVRQLMLFDPKPGAATALLSLQLSEPPARGFLPWPQIANAGTGLLVFANPNSYPRVYLARSAVAVNDSKSAMDALLDVSTDLRERSVYEGGLAASAPHASSPSNGLAVIKIDDPERITIDCDADSQRLLVLCDRMDQGWTVRIDGKPAEALTANYLFRGVFVPAGHHTVEWTYRAPGLAVGVAISLATLAVVILILLTGVARIYLRHG